MGAFLPVKTVSALVDRWYEYVQKQNASHARRHERRNRLRGSTLVYHSVAAHNAGHAEGFHIPHAPGRTFRTAVRDGFQPVTVPLLAKLWRVLFPFIALFGCVLYYQHFPAVSSVLFPVVCLIAVIHKTLDNVF